ncbi:hypothetical protein [Sphingomonas oryzagri]
MLKFVVRKGHDAFVYYETVVDADTPEKALLLAESHDYDGEWIATGDVSEFDDYEIDETDGVRPLDDGETIEGYIALGLTATERDALPAGLRLIQSILRTGRFTPVRDDAAPDASRPGLDPKAIDDLIERIDFQISGPPAPSSSTGRAWLSPSTRAHPDRRPGARNPTGSNGRRGSGK